MSNYKRRRSSGKILQNVVYFLLIILLIGLIASVFSRSPDTPEPGETQAPTTSVTDPTDDPTKVPSEDPTDSGVTLITFSVSGFEIQCENGMSWQEFIDSSYNTLGFYVDSSYSVMVSHEAIGSSFTVMIETDPPTPVISDALIIADFNYTGM